MMLIKILYYNPPVLSVHLLMPGEAACVLPGNHHTHMLFSG